MEKIDIKNLEVLKNEKDEKYYKRNNWEYRYSINDSYNTLLKGNNIINFLDLYDLYGDSDNEKIYGKDEIIQVYKGESVSEYYFDGEKKRYVEPAGYQSEYRYRYYNRNELVEKYFNGKSDEGGLIEYINNLAEENKNNLKDRLIDYCYVLSISDYPFNFYRSRENKYFIHNKYNWEDIWAKNSNLRRENVIKMRNIFVNHVNEHNLNFSQSIILSILFPELISNENYSKIIPTEDNNIMVLEFKSAKEKRGYSNNNELENGFTIKIDKTIIEKIKNIFNDDYIFNLSPIELYCLKSKFKWLLKEDFSFKYSNITKNNIINLALYTKDEEQFNEYLELIKEELPEIQDKLIEVIMPYSSKESIKRDYTDNEIYNVIKLVNTLKFYRGYHIDVDYECIVEDYKNNLKFSNVYRKNDNRYKEKELSAEILSKMTIHKKDNIYSLIKLFSNDFNIEIKTDIIAMNPYFVDIFETYFLDKFDVYKEIVKSNEKEKDLDEMLRMKNDILKYAYTDAYVSEKDYEKLIVVKDFVDKYCDLKLSTNNVINNDESKKIKVKTK